MTSSESATPAPVQDHPALELRIGTADEKATLSKLTPITVPNDDLVETLQKSYPKDKRWKEFRHDFRYIYVINWMYQCRGYIKLASEHFDADLFEIELFNIVTPPPIDDLSLILHKARLALISRVHGRKAESLALFESLFRAHFGINTPLGGVEATEEDEQLTTDLPTFDDLYIDQKIEILYILIVKVTQYADFREYLERNKIAPEFARPSILFRCSDPNHLGTLEDYLLVFDDTAMYKRIVKVAPLEIPAKRRLSPDNPEEYFGEDAFDAQSVKYELIYKDAYRLEEFIKELKVNKNKKKNRLLLDVIKKPAAISNVFDYEIRKRRILMSRKKENEMARLLATRKKSSRLEAKVKQRAEIEHDRKLRELEEQQFAPTRRSQRTYNYLENKIKSDFTAGLSRDERLKLRKGTSKIEELVDPIIHAPPRVKKSEAPSSFTETPVAESLDVIVPVEDDTINSISLPDLDPQGQSEGFENGSESAEGQSPGILNPNVLEDESKLNDDILKSEAAHKNEKVHEDENGA